MIHLNGQLLAKTEAHIQPFDRGLLLGDGLFETIAVISAEPRFFSDHMRRLRHGAKVLGITLPFSETSIESFASELLVAKGLKDAVLRITVTRGPADRGLWPAKNASPTIIITADPIDFSEKPPAAAWIARNTRRNHLSPLSACKTLNYGDSLLAAREADRHGATVAILLNSEDRVAETATGNLFAVFGQKLVTPPVSEGALPGIMRAKIRERFGGTEETLNANDLGSASELFAANTLGIRAIAQINGKPLKAPAPGPVTADVIKALQP